MNKQFFKLGFLLFCGTFQTCVDSPLGTNSGKSNLLLQEEFDSEVGIPIAYNVSVWSFVDAKSSLILEEFSKCR